MQTSFCVYVDDFGNFQFNIVDLHEIRDERWVGGTMYSVHPITRL